MSRPPSLFTFMRRPMNGTLCPKSQLKSTCLTAKFGSFFTRKQAKRGKMWSILLSNIRFLWFLQSMFLLSYLYQWCGFCWQSKSVITVCLHCSFTRLKNKHIWVTGDQCSHNKLATLVPSVWVYIYTDYKSNRLQCFTRSTVALSIYHHLIVFRGHTTFLLEKTIHWNTQISQIQGSTPTSSLFTQEPWLSGTVYPEKLFCTLLHSLNTSRAMPFQSSRYSLLCMAATSCSSTSFVLFLVHRFAYVLFWSTFYFRLRAVDVTSVYSHLFQFSIYCCKGNTAPSTNRCK